MGEVDENRPVATWTLDQIRQVRGLRAEARLAVEVIERAAFDVKTETRAKLVRRLIDMALRRTGVEPHPADFQFAESAAEDSVQQVAIRCWWEPDVTEVEFQGGASDGMVLQVENAPTTPVHVPLPPSTPIWFDLDESASEPISLPYLTYEVTGWDETARHWIYEVRR